MSFFYEFQDLPCLLENIIPLQDNLYILGDFNLHLDNAKDKPINSMKSSHVLISSSMLISQLTFMISTHVHVHDWLDVLITKNSDNPRRLLNK